MIIILSALSSQNKFQFDFYFLKKSQEWKKIFHIKNLHIGHVAKSFGLREAPNKIVGNELKLFKGSKRSGTESNNGKFQKNTKNFSNKKNFEQNPSYNEDIDHLNSKYARDLKRLSNNHKEYGNVAKKNKLRSQKANLDLRLLFCKLF